MRTALVLLNVAVLLVACAAPVQVTPAGPWRYVKHVPGCLRFVGDRGPNAQATIVLDDTFRDSLLGKLPAGSVPSPQCWYEKPDGSVLLQAGDSCLSPHWVTFTRNNGDWQVSRIDDPFMSCNPKAST